MREDVPDDEADLIVESDLLQRQVRPPSEHAHCADVHHAVPSIPYSLLRVRVVASAVIMLFSLALSPATSVLSQYLIDRLAREAHLNQSVSNQSHCGQPDQLNVTNSGGGNEDQLQAKVSTLIMYYSYCACGPGLIFALLIGAYADHFGRRITLLLPLMGLTVKYAFIAFIMHFDLDLRLFYLAHVLEGLSGTSFMVFLALYTITADTNQGRGRILWITIINSLGSIMSACSNIASGLLIRQFGFFLAYSFLMSAMTLAFLIPLVFLPETKPAQEVKLLRLSHNIRRVFGFFLFDGPLRLKMAYTVLLVMFFFSVINELGISSIDTLYQLHVPFCWNSKLIGYYSAFKSGGANMLGVFLLAGIRRCMRSEFIGLLAVFFQGAAYCWEAFARTDWQLFLVPVIAIPSCLITPVVRGLMSLLAAPQHQGALFTSICVFEVACNMAASTVFNKVYAVTVSSFAGSVYLYMTGFSALTFLLMIGYIQIRKDQTQSPAYEKIINADVQA